jgi:hypothetical protein
LRPLGFGSTKTRDPAKRVRFETRHRLVAAREDDAVEGEAGQGDDVGAQPFDLPRSARGPWTRSAREISLAPLVGRSQPLVSPRPNSTSRRSCSGRRRTGVNLEA